jgi:hypothetical protein
MAASLEKELSMIRERLDSIENVLDAEMSEDNERFSLQRSRSTRKARPSPSSGTVID